MTPEERQALKRRIDEARRHRELSDGICPECLSPFERAKPQQRHKVYCAKKCANAVAERRRDPVKRAAWKREWRRRRKGAT